MRDQDKRPFSIAALAPNIHDAGLWILVRDTNPASLQYMGLPGHRPKGMDCKAKTAPFNTEPYRHAGLVVQPFLCPRSFKPDKLNGAKSEWCKFVIKHPVQPWATDTNGKSMPANLQPDCTVNSDKEDLAHYGCLLFHGVYLHGDYDLYDIILADRPTRNLAAVGDDGQSTRGRYFRDVAELVNGMNKLDLVTYDREGVDMVLHGAQAQGFGHIDDDTIYVFGPHAEYEEIHGGVVAWYQRKFRGRRAIDLRQPAAQGQPGWQPRIVR
jgi:hypothetical protein